MLSKEWLVIISEHLSALVAALLELVSCSCLNIYVELFRCLFKCISGHFVLLSKSNGWMENVAAFHGWQFFISNLAVNIQCIMHYLIHLTVTISSSLFSVLSWEYCTIYHMSHLDVIKKKVDSSIKFGTWQLSHIYSHDWLKNLLAFFRGKPKLESSKTLVCLFLSICSPFALRANNIVYFMDHNVPTNQDVLLLQTKTYNLLFLA